MAKDKLFFFKVVLLLITIYIIFSLFMPKLIQTKAIEPNYTTAIDDLAKDTEFAVYNYFKDSNNHSIEMINLAESIDKELFIYVYNPDCSRIASSINISATEDNSINFNNYKLKLISNQYTIAKYLIEGLTLPIGKKKYYNISTIYRPFDSAIDKQPDNGNVITEVACPINREYCIYDENGVTKTTTHEIETITITDKFVGYVEYDNGFILYSSACHSHFVAFDTDKPIDNLIEADVYYTSQPYGCRTETKTGIGCGIKKYPQYGEKNENVAHLTYKDKITYTGNGFRKATYTWNRINKVSDFILNENIEQTVYTGATLDVNRANQINENGKQKLINKKWILRFTETPYEYVYADNKSSESSTLIGDVSILRLKFDTNGVVYNLGVIDNKTKEPPIGPSINEEDDEIRPLTPKKIWERLQKQLNEIFKNYWWIIVLLIVGFFLFFNPKFIVYVLKFIYKIILIPFTLCKTIYRKIKQNNFTKNNDIQLKNSNKSYTYIHKVNISNNCKKKKVLLKMLNGGADKVYITKNNKICLKQYKKHIDKHGNNCTIVNTYYIPNTKQNRIKAEDSYGKLNDNISKRRFIFIKKIKNN